MGDGIEWERSGCVPASDGLPCLYSTDTASVECWRSPPVCVRCWAAVSSFPRLKCGIAATAATNTDGLAEGRLCVVSPADAQCTTNLTSEVYSMVCDILVMAEGMGAIGAWSWPSSDATTSKDIDMQLALS